ncbi:MAG: hypothetical protein Q4D79_11315 [Propionibacteriaceae bacterium]|nr:hypothetical protein [Propionibacteriaceae bacterium]
MLSNNAVKRSLISAIAVALIGAPVCASPNEASAATTVNTIADLMNSSGLSGTVFTRGEEKVGDGGALSFTISATKPTGKLGHVAIPLADGKWAVPNNLPPKPLNSVDSAAVADALKRAQTFADAGNDLVWDATRAVRKSPLAGVITHQVTPKPYPITCSQFVGMVLIGWDYEHTTYVADQNTRVGHWVDFGHNPIGSRIWQANNLAAWFYANGDLWFDQEQQYEAGDVLFFSKQDPEGSNAKVRQGEAEAYFGNIYHTALYLGDGKIMHAAEQKRGVIIQDLEPSLAETLTFVARPKWVAANNQAVNSPSADSQGPVSTPSAAPTVSQLPTPTLEAAGAPAISQLPTSSPDGAGAPIRYVGLPKTGQPL